MRCDVKLGKVFISPMRLLLKIFIAIRLEAVYNEMSIKFLYLFRNEQMIF